MRYRVLAFVFSLCLTAAGQSLNIEKLSLALRNGTGTDAEIAGYLAKVKLTERLDDRTLEDLQSQRHLGPKTVAALHKLHDQSASMPVAAAVAPVEPLRPIPVPSAEEQGRILDDVRNYALNYSENLPDFICFEVESRWGAPPVKGSAPAYRKLDELTKRLTYFQQKEDYKLIMRNNTVANNQDVKSAGGSQSFGDFGSMMRQVFDPATEAKFDWEAWHTLRDQRVMVFNYRVALDRSRYHITYDKDRDIVTAYHGWVDVDPTTHQVMRIAVVADNIPPDFPVKSASDILDYDYQNLSGHSFLLPSKATIEMSVGDFVTRNNKEFRTYSKYSADALIKYDGDLTAPVKK